MTSFFVIHVNWTTLYTPARPASGGAWSASACYMIDQNLHIVERPGTRPSLVCWMGKGRASAWNGFIAKEKHMNTFHILDEPTILVICTPPTNTYLKDESITYDIFKFNDKCLQQRFNFVSVWTTVTCFLCSLSSYKITNYTDVSY